MLPNRLKKHSAIELRLLSDGRQMPQDVQLLTINNSPRSMIASALITSEIAESYIPEYVAIYLRQFPTGFDELAPGHAIARYEFDLSVTPISPTDISKEMRHRLIAHKHDGKILILGRDFCNAKAILK